MTSSVQTDFSSFSDLPDSATIRFFSITGSHSGDDLLPMVSVVNELLNQWQTDGKIRNGVATMLHKNRFLAVAFQPTGDDISGCTKDSLTHLIQDFEERLAISILSAPRFSVITGDGVVHLSMKEFRERRQAGEFNESTTVFDHLITNLGDARNGAFEKNVSNSWYAPVGA